MTIEVKEIVKRFADFFSNRSFTYIAEKIFEDGSTGLSIRTLRRYVAEYLLEEDEEQISNEFLSTPESVVYDETTDFFDPTLSAPVVYPDSIRQDYDFIDGQMIRRPFYSWEGDVLPASTPESMWNEHDREGYTEEELPGIRAEALRQLHAMFGSSNSHLFTAEEFAEAEARDCSSCECETPCEEEDDTLQPYEGGDPDNVLIIGDIHEPFSREGYLEHCREAQEVFNCGTVVFIGDIVDHHYSSYHATDPDGYGAGEELDRAIDKIAEWYRVFPKAKVTLGNHDQLIMRKAYSSGVSSRWIKGLDEVYKTPNWEYDLEFEVGGVLYRHGTGTSGEKGAYNVAMNNRQSVVQGHLHTVANILWNVSANDRIFAMQVGCGIDDKAYTFAYAAGNAKKSIISCGVVLNHQIPIVVPMNL